jgi:transglutaminase-like putative cysteine protease
VRRTAAAAFLPAVAITGAWLSVEEPRLIREGAAVAALALLPALVHARWARTAAVIGSALVAAWIAFLVQPWELLPFRDERVVAPVVRDVAQGVVDFYAVFLPFEPRENVEMHSLVLSAIFGFTLAVGLLVAARRPISAAAVTVAAVGWPATLAGWSAVAFGMAALASALAIPLVLRTSSARTFVVGAGIGALVVLSAAAASATTTLARDAALDWNSWDIRGPARQASTVKFIWNSNYNGIHFPAERTVVLEIDGPESPYYWRTTTLDVFTRDHWFEYLYSLDQVDPGSRALRRPSLVPRRAADPGNWVDQHVRVEALVDDHLAAAGTPMGLEAHRLGTVFHLSGGVLRASALVGPGASYRVWSYVPDPVPRTLADAPVRYPRAIAPFLVLDGRPLPSFESPGRERLVRALFADPSYASFARYRPLEVVARRIAGRAKTPYEAVLALESWFRQTGGFTYDETPPRSKRSPLVDFVTRTKAGYCQHFAGAMAVMLRMLGIPARVAVGFTSGTRNDGTWVVTDHEAHAWVEVWFAGVGWIPFDPTPGRGRFGGNYSFASTSATAVAALRRGELSRSTLTRPNRRPDVSDLGATGTVGSKAPSLVGVLLVLAALWVGVVGIGKAVVRRARYLSRDPRRVATASRRELEGFLRDQGAAVPRNATLVTLQDAVYRELGLDGRAFAIAAARARFGPPHAVERGAASARTELRRLLRSARRELSLWARFRGFVSLRSLRSAGTL